MQIGIFARTFSRPSLAALLDAIAGQGVDCVQFNFFCVGLPTLPETIEDSLADEISREIKARNLSMAAVSGTFNLIHPDAAIRQDGLRRLPVLANACKLMGCPVITLCTGTRDPENMWRRHPDNDQPAAWNDLLKGISQALEIAESTGIMLGIEPEPGNVVSTARKGRQLLDEMQSARLKIVMDAANLFNADNLAFMRPVLDEAFDLLGGDIAIAHAKDVRNEGSIKHLAAGKGALDYDHYLARLKECGFSGPLILHELQEAEAPGCIAFLREKLRTVK